MGPGKIRGSEAPEIFEWPVGMTCTAKVQNVKGICCKNFD